MPKKKSFVDLAKDFRAIVERETLPPNVRSRTTFTAEGKREIVNNTPSQQPSVIDSNELMRARFARRSAEMHQPIQAQQTINVAPPRTFGGGSMTKSGTRTVVEDMKITSSPLVGNHVNIKCFVSPHVARRLQEMVQSGEDIFGHLGSAEVPKRIIKPEPEPKPEPPKPKKGRKKNRVIKLQEPPKREIKL